MERASDVYNRIDSRSTSLSEEQLVQAAWTRAVGKRIAAHTDAPVLIRSRAVIGVRDEIWKRQLFSLRGQILGKLQQHLGRALVTELEFRVVPGRRPPAREVATVAGAAAGQDEADGIGDPILRLLYRTARRKETA